MYNHFFAVTSLLEILENFLLVVSERLCILCGFHDNFEIELVLNLPLEFFVLLDGLLQLEFSFAAAAPATLGQFLKELWIICGKVELAFAEEACVL